MKEPNISGGRWTRNGHCVTPESNCEKMVCDCGDAEMVKDPRVETADAQFISCSKEMAKLLYRIYMADKTGNNGAIMGEAVLCPHFSNAAHRLLLEAGYTDTEEDES
jgi:hypothetical protein